MKDTYKPCVLFAVSPDLLPTDAYLSLKEALESFLKRPVKELTGCENGETETVYLCEFEDKDTLDRVIYLAIQCRQDYIFLIRDNRECAKMMLPSGEIVPQGTLRGVSKVEAERNGTYTTDGVTYWVAKEDSEPYSYDD
jgi:hypothetical protein